VGQITYTHNEVKLLREMVEELHDNFVKHGFGVLPSVCRSAHFTEEGIYRDCWGRDGSDGAIIHDAVTHLGIKAEGEEVGPLADNIYICSDMLACEVIRYISERGRVYNHGLIWRVFPQIRYQYPKYNVRNFYSGELESSDGGYMGYCRLSIFNEEGKQVHAV
jgi:hypothetical protein